MALPKQDWDEPIIYQPTYEEGMAILDRNARELIGMSGEEFVRRFDAGEFSGIEEDEFGRAVVTLSFYVPFARQGSMYGIESLPD